MNGDKLYDKAARLMERASGEEMLMRNFYEDLARSYSRLGWEADRLAQNRKTEQEEQKRETVNINEVLARLMRLTLSHSAMEQIGGGESPDNLG